MDIYHLAWASDWQRCERDGWYRPDSLATEGFVHCTREPHMLLTVANEFFAEQRGEPLLCVRLDEGAVGADVRDEDPGVGHLFPHVYGPITLDAVREVRPLERRDGRWHLPEP